MAQPSDAQRQTTWHDLVLATHLLDTALERQAQRDGAISHGHIKILVLLSSAPDSRLSLKQLADSLRFSISRISHAVSSLQENGLVERRPLAGGRRSFEAVLTGAGREKVRGVLGAQRRGIRDPLLDGLGAARENELAVIAARLVELLDDQLSGTPDD